MKRTVICMFFVLLFVWSASAQTKSKTGTVTEYNLDYKTITVNIGKALPKGNYELDGTSSYIAFTVAWGAYGCLPKKCKNPAPKIVGDVKTVGRKVRVYYTRIDSEHGFGYILKATKIVEVE